MFAVDTNILLYGVNRDAPEHKKALKFLDRIRKGPSVWFLTWNIVYEFLRVSTHASVFSQPLALSSAIGFIQALRSSANLVLLNETERHFEILKELNSRYPRVSANLVHDFHTASLLYERGIRTLYTADRDFLQFEFLEVIDPIH